MYMGMRSGAPQPMTTIWVRGKSVERREGGRERERVRRYSWQFCSHYSSAMDLKCVSLVRQER